MFSLGIMIMEYSTQKYRETSDDIDVDIAWQYITQLYIRVDPLGDQVYTVVQENEINIKIDNVVTA
jgi:hypothetical protein